MLYTQKIKIRQSRAVSRKICQIEKESTLTYDLAVKACLSNGKCSLYDIINMIPDWRAANSLTAHSLFHEAAAKEAYNGVKAFRVSCSRKHSRRLRLKKKLRLGKISRYRRNRYTSPASLLRSNNPRPRLRSVSSRARPMVVSKNEIRLPGIGIVKTRSGLPQLRGEPRSFKLVDRTRKVTRLTANADREFELHLQALVPDALPDRTKAAGGMDLGVKHLAATADSNGGERLHNMRGGCRRYRGDRIDKLKSRQSGLRRGSRKWKEAGRQVRAHLTKVRNRQRHEEIRIARSIAAAMSTLFIEDLKLERMTRSNGHPGKTGLNREMRYSRLGSFRDEVVWQMEKAGGDVVKVDARNTSITCFACGFMDRRSRDAESFTCTFCGWYHHADKNAAGNLLLTGCLRPETGGKAHYHDGGAANAGRHVVARREDRDGGAHAPRYGRLGPGNDIRDNWSDRAPKRVIASNAGYG